MLCCRVVAKKKNQRFFLLYLNYFNTFYRVTQYGTEVAWSSYYIEVHLTHDIIYRLTQYTGRKVAWSSLLILHRKVHLTHDIVR
jgi:hypothetical protein